MLFSWLSINKLAFDENIGLTLISVIIPFRNEKQNLKPLIESLKNQNYNSSNFEVILVNDHSDDEFSIPELPENFKLLHLPKEFSGKKNANSFGVDHSKNDIIVTSDADCIHDKNWLNTINQSFISDEIKMVFGAVRFHDSGTLFNQLQQVEFAPVVGVGAASCNLGKPMMCNGANMAFRKSVFEEVHGYDGNSEIPTGDDEFLLYKISKRYPQGIKYVNSEKAIVTTHACSSFFEFFHQRKRWASKWSANKSIFKSTSAVLIFMASLATLTGVTFLFFNHSILVISILSLKIIIDGIFIYSVLKTMNRSFNLLVLLIAQLVYPFYVILIGIAANFGLYTWKGRRF